MDSKGRWGEEKCVILARVVGDADRPEDGLGRVCPGEVDGGGDDGGDGSDEAVHLRWPGPWHGRRRSWKRALVE